MKIKYFLFQLIVILGCCPVYAAADSQPAFDLPAVKIDDLKNIPGAENVDKATQAAPLVRSEFHVNMQITVPDRRGFTAKDAETGISVDIKYPRLDLLEPEDPENPLIAYTLAAAGKDNYLNEYIDVYRDKHRPQEYSYNMKNRELALQLDTFPAGVQHYGQLYGKLQGSADIYLRVNRNSGPGYSVTGEGLSLELQGLVLTGTIREGAYTNKALTAIISMVLLLHTEYSAIDAYSIHPHYY